MIATMPAFKTILCTIYVKCALLSGFARMQNTESRNIHTAPYASQILLTWWLTWTWALTFCYSMHMHMHMQLTIKFNYYYLHIYWFMYKCLLWSKG